MFKIALKNSLKWLCMQESNLEKINQCNQKLFENDKEIDVKRKKKMERFALKKHKKSLKFTSVNDEIYFIVRSKFT